MGFVSNMTSLFSRDNGNTTATSPCRTPSTEVETVSPATTAGSSIKSVSPSPSVKAEEGGSGASTPKAGVSVAVAGGDDAEMPEVLRSLDQVELETMERKIKKRMSIRLMLPLFIGYFMCILTRGNVGAARTVGLDEDLHMTGNQSLACLSAFYVGIILCQVPVTMYMAKFRKPALFLCMTMAFFGIITLSTGFVKGFGAMFTCRLLLGCFEAAFYPGAQWLMSSWYTRSQLASSSCILFSAQHLATAMSSLVTAGLLQGHGIAGYASWRWLFWTTGGFTTVISLLGLWLMPDLPDDTKYLTEVERSFVKWRLSRDAGADEEEGNVTWSGVMACMKNPKVLLFSGMMFFYTAYGAVAIVFPTLVEGLGYNETKTNCLVAPPFIIAAILSIVIGFSAQRNTKRFVFIVVPTAISMTSFIVGASTTNAVARYVFMCTMVIGTTGFPIGMAWMNNTLIRPASLRASSSAVVNFLSTTNHVGIGFLFQDKYTPQMAIPLAVMAGLALMTMVFAVATRHVLVHDNKRLTDGTAVFVDGEVRKLAAVGEGETAEDEKVDHGFRYYI